MKLSIQKAEEVLEKLDFKRKLSGMELVVAIARDWGSGDVLMQGYMNKEAVLKTLTTGKVTYWSTSRRELWTKGDNSGFTQELKAVSVDCDGDSILMDVEQKGPACHTGLRSCFDTYRLEDEVELKRELIDAIKQDALNFGNFTLASGKKSNYYISIKKITTRPDRLSLIARLISNRFASDVDVVAGPELGAIPIVVSVALRSNLPYAMIRKSERSHGTLQQVEGELGKGDKVLLIDDVTTSGGSLVMSIEAIRSTGADVSNVTCVVDRKEGAAELLREKCGVELAPLLTVDDLGLSP